MLPYVSLDNNQGELDSLRRGACWLLDPVPIDSLASAAAVFSPDVTLPRCVVLGQCDAPRVAFLGWCVLQRCIPSMLFWAVPFLSLLPVVACLIFGLSPYKSSQGFSPHRPAPSPAPTDELWSWECPLG